MNAKFRDSHVIVQKQKGTGLQQLRMLQRRHVLVAHKRGIFIVLPRGDVDPQPLVNGASSVFFVLDRFCGFDDLLEQVLKVFELMNVGHGVLGNDLHG